MNVDKTLSELRKSLEPKPVGHAPKLQTHSTVDIAQALLKLPNLADSLEKLIAEKRHETDLLTAFTRIDFDVKTLADKTDQNLREIAEVKVYVVQRLKAMDSLEAKWSLLIERVSDVCYELERVLKRM